MQKDLKHNLIVNTGDGALFAFAMGMVPLNTVIVFYISGYVHQKWLIGLLSLLHILLMFTPQIVVSKKLEGLTRYKPFLMINAFIQRFIWLLLGLSIILFEKNNTTVFIIVFYFLFSMLGLVSAFSSITWLNFIIKIIPENIRGKYFGIRATISGLFESMGALVMGAIIKSLPYPYNYAALFIIVFIITMMSYASLSLSKETPIEVRPRTVINKSNFSRMAEIIKDDKNFVNYLITVILMGAIGKMPFTFHIVFAKDKLALDSTQLSLTTFILLASQTLGYLYWGFLADKHGYKSTLMLSGLIFLPSLITVYLMPNIFIFYISIALFGIAQSARNVNENNLAIRLCRERSNQALYIGFRNLISGPMFAFSPLIAGVILDFMGSNTLFIISIISMIAGTIMMKTHVREFDHTN